MSFAFLADFLKCKIFYNLINFMFAFSVTWPFFTQAKLAKKRVMFEVAKCCHQLNYIDSKYIRRTLLEYSIGWHAGGFLRLSVRDFMVSTRQ